jgi:hypothetical protein
MQKLLLLLIVTMFFPPYALSATAASDSEVIFYSQGSLLALAAGTKHEAFAGYIFDGQERIALLPYRRFLAVRLPAGMHIFSASYSGKSPAKNSQLSLNLVVDKIYFIRADAEGNGLISIYPRGRLDEVSCQEANVEADKIKPVKKKNIPSQARLEIVALTSMPSCH